MEQSPEQNVEDKDEELWQAAQGMARKTKKFRFVAIMSVIIAGFTLYVFIVWGLAKQWTWQEVCVNFGIFYIAWGAFVAVFERVFFGRNEAIALSDLVHVRVVQLARIILERDLAMISIIFFSGGLIAEVARFALQVYKVN